MGLSYVIEAHDADFSIKIFFSGPQELKPVILERMMISLEKGGVQEANILRLLFYFSEEKAVIVMLASALRLLHIRETKGINWDCKDGHSIEVKGILLPEQ
jgi:hypothetical protein